MKALLLIFALAGLSHSMQQESQDVLELFYNTLSNKASLPWDFNSELCDQEGLECNEEGYLSSIFLISQNLIGSIPSEFGLLSNLTSLYLSQHDFGELPEEIFEIEGAGSSFFINSCKLSGQIPDNIFQIAYTDLQLIGNFLTGTIPTTIAQSLSMTISFSKNKLDGTIPSEITQSKNLVSFSAMENDLFGSLPSGLNNTEIYFLDFSDNTLNGTIPSDMGTKITTLRLSNNQLEGTIPSYLASSASELSLNQNNFHGELPVFSVALKKLDLSNNMFEGTIGNSLINSIELSELSLNFNKLNGTIPQYLLNLNLNNLFLAGNDWVCPPQDYSINAKQNDYMDLVAQCDNFCAANTCPQYHTCILRSKGKSSECLPPECDSPCLNGGECTGKNQCLCPPQFYGDTCQNENLCINNPCKNGGKCFHSPGSYTCSCPASFTGKDCEKDVNECANAPCLNGATCLNTKGSYFCQCKAGYYGLTCQYDYNECNPNPCKNGGVCVDKENTYECLCTYPFSGPLCEISNPCVSNPCLNGATCSPSGSVTYSCSCVGGFSGANCEKEQSKSSSNSLVPIFSLVFLILFILFF